MDSEIDIQHQVEAVRRFNRFYTRQIGALNEGLARTPFSLAQARVLYELAHRTRCTATEISNALSLDPGYLSRILRGFRKRGLIATQRSATDGRQRVLWLTNHGQRAFAALEGQTREDIRAMLRGVSPSDGRRLLEAMRTIEEILDAAPCPDRPDHAQVRLRPPRPGDLGWVVHRHGVLYAREYGWDERFEALVAGIVAKFVEHHDPTRERCWIAERGSDVVGSVFLVKESDTVAKLRLLLVEPTARGLGIGKRLVAACIEFARQAGYQKITLWTNSVLRAARHIYAEAGFRLVHEEQHHSFGHHLTAETWEMVL